MKTLDDILVNYEKYKTFLQDRLGARLCDFLTVEQAKKIGFEITESDHTPLPWTRENILHQLEQDVEFGFEKALGQRGISSSLMFEVVLGWNAILEEGLENWPESDYKQYGLPLFKAAAEKYGWSNPIGEDTGREFKYGIDEYWLDDLCLPVLYKINDTLGLTTTASRAGEWKGQERDEWNVPEIKEPYITFYDRPLSFVTYLRGNIPGTKVDEDKWGRMRIRFPKVGTKEDAQKLWKIIENLTDEYRRNNS